MSIDRNKAAEVIRSMVVKRVEVMGDAMVKDLKDEISDPVLSRVTINLWPLRKDTGALQRSVSDEVTPTADGVNLVIGRGIKWYGAFWELVGKWTRRGFRRYPWFWSCFHRNRAKYMAILGVTSTTGANLGAVGSSGASGSNYTARQSWRKRAGMVK